MEQNEEPLAGADLASLDNATEWLNSEPLTESVLRGKVVLIDFWTYTCINWLRSLPYVRAWADKYKENGLVVIGVHTPEFPFEHDLGNVRRAVQVMQINYPLVIDNEYEIWRAFSNHYWPALYFVDSSGQVRAQQFGEGEYQQSEAIIQQLLAETGRAEIGGELVSVDARGVEAAADWGNLRSSESYVGYERADDFAAVGGAIVDQRHVYAPPSYLNLNHWALAGDWTIQQQSALLNEAGGQIAYRFHARDLHLVMGPATANTSVRFRVLIDGEPPGTAHGVDIDQQGNGVVTDQRLYQLIRQAGAVVEHLFEITFADPGVQAYVFTFG
ncbi:redoxin domain-containing protein [Jatrophihabitans sp. DSM 45814]